MAISTANIASTNNGLDLAIANNGTLTCSPKRLQTWATKVGLTISAPIVKAGVPGTTITIANSNGEIIALANGPLARPAYGAALVLVKEIISANTPAITAAA